MNLFSNSGREKSYGEKLIGSSLTEALNTISCRLERGDTRGPGRWLARGKESSEPETVLRPQAGQYGTYGVFFADHEGGLVLPKNGFIYVADSKSYTWLVSDSKEWTQIENDVARQRGLDISKIGDGMAADDILYHEHCVYQSYHGYATINNAVTASDLRHIIKKVGNDYRLIK